jgi:hypothetical protein
LTEAGKTELTKPMKILHSDRKAHIHIRTAESDPPGLYVMSSSSSTPATHQVQDSLHSNVSMWVKSDFRTTTPTKVHLVSAIKCPSGADREKVNGFEDSVARNVLVLIQQLVRHNLNPSSC